MRSDLLSRVVAHANRMSRSQMIAVALLTGGFSSGVLAGDVAPQLGQSQELRKMEPAKITVYSKPGQDSDSAPPFVSPGGKGAQTAPQPYQRTAGQVPVKNYYNELFNGNNAVQQAGGVNTAGSVQTIPTTQQSANTLILNAEYNVEEGASPTGVILPAGGEMPVQQTADLPEWARGAKSSGSVATGSPTAVQPVSAQQPVLTLTPQSGSPLSTSQQPTPTQSLQTTTPTATMSLKPPVSVQQPQADFNLNSAVSTQPAQAKSPLIVPTESLASGPQNPSVSIEWKGGTDINVGQECECELVVVNTGNSDAFGVQVTAQFPPTVRLLDATPKPTSAVNALVWDLGRLEQGHTTRIKVKMLPSQRGALAATAQVQFTGAAQSSFVVREPLLGLDMEGPQKVMVGDPASHSVTISNPGNGIAKNVKLEAIIPAGLEHSRGERLMMDVGSLNPGESRTIRLALAAVSGGSQVVQVAATAEGGLAKSANSAVEVISPSLQAEISGPSLRYKGRSATFTVKVANDGTVNTNNVRLMHKIPEGFKFVSASKGATYDGPTRILSWFVGKLDANKTAEMEVELVAEQIGEFVHYIRATSEHGTSIDSQMLTRVEGASALLLEVVDLDDPVEVGSETAYEVTIHNQGSAAAQKVGLTCELPSGVRFVKAEGPCQHVVDGNLVLFQPLETLPAGKSSKFRVFVVGDVEGNLRFRARMTSSASPEPLTFEELTRFYGDQR